MLTEAELTRLAEILADEEYVALDHGAALALLTDRRHADPVPTSDRLTWRGIADVAGIAGMLRLRGVAEAVAAGTALPEPDEDAPPGYADLYQVAQQARPAVAAALAWMEPSEGGISPGHPEVRQLLDLLAAVGDAAHDDTATGEAVAAIKAAGERPVSDADRAGLRAVTWSDVQAARMRPLPSQ